MPGIILVMVCENIATSSLNVIGGTCMKRFKLLIFVVCCISAIIIGACGEDDDNPAGPGGDENNNGGSNEAHGTLTATVAGTH